MNSSQKEIVTKEQNSNGQWVTTIQTETNDNGRITRTTRKVTEERSTTVASSSTSTSFIGKLKAKFSHTEPIQETVTTTKTIQPSIQLQQSYKTATTLEPKLYHSSSNSNKKTDFNKTKFENECLNAHNEYRRKHRVPPLILDRELCNYAQEWANTIANNGRMQHRANTNFGENIYWSSGMTVNGQKPVQSWYDEIKDYKFAKGGFNPNTGHFSQVVWKSSEKLGVGIKEINNQIFVVANYDPAGNFQGEYDKNVLPPM